MKQPMDHQRKAPRTRSAKPGTHWLRAIAAYRNRAVLTAADYLAALGADSEFRRRFSSSFGRVAAKVYRAEYGTEPARIGWAVAHGRLTPVFAYTAAVLEKAAVTYVRTQPLLIGA
jgi:hypothetical protein